MAVEFLIFDVILEMRFVFDFYSLFLLKQKITPIYLNNCVRLAFQIVLALHFCELCFSLIFNILFIQFSSVIFHELYGFIMISIYILFFLKSCF